MCMSYMCMFTAHPLNVQGVQDREDDTRPVCAGAGGVLRGPGRGGLGGRGPGAKKIEVLRKVGRLRRLFDSTEVARGRVASDGPGTDVFARTVEQTDHFHSNCRAN